MNSERVNLDLKAKNSEKFILKMEKILIINLLNFVFNK